MKLITMTQQEINNTSMLKVGTILRGTYRIDSYLSSGGFGNTYVATNVEFDERVAIKEFFMKGVTQRDDNQTTVSVSNAENSNSFLEQKEKFKKEARRIRQLKNEHIVSVHDLFEENGTAYYVMDYVDGENLAERLKKTGRPMTESEIRLILPQILDALKAVHAEKMWHLDLKPANIMLEKGGKVKLIDFGASKQLNAQKGGATTSTAISYTNGYAPREQMEQNYDKFGPWTDIYALGATLYNLLTNKRPPLPSDIDDDESVDKHQSLPFSDSVSAEMKSMVLMMLNTNRLQRPQSVDAIICAEKTRRVTPQQQATYQRSASYEDEETLIATPKPKKEEKKVESKVKVESQTTTQTSYTYTSQESNDNNGSGKGIKNEVQQENNKIWKWIIPVVFIIGIIVWGVNRSNTMSEEVSGNVATDVITTDTIAIFGPKYKTVSKEGWLSIKSILLTQEDTRIDFEYVNRYEQGGWCSIDENTYISDGVNQYKMKSAINIDIAPKQTAFSQQWQILNFTLVFPPLRKDIKTIDFIEGTDGSTWNLKDICIDAKYYEHRDKIITSMLNKSFDQDAISGTFTMGNAGWVDTDPPSKVTLSDFLISRYEVTQEQWECIMGSNPSYDKGNNKPVTNVSWNDCQTYIQELVRITGIPFQLPTEAQWEFAARGGKKSKGYKYAGSNSLDDVAWYLGNSSNTIHEVGLKKPNELGLYDMSGNVWEWCLDYDGKYNAKSKKDPSGPDSGKDRIVRGGSHYENATVGNEGFSNFWVFARGRFKDTDMYSNLGFRLVINLPNQQ